MRTRAAAAMIAASLLCVSAGAAVALRPTIGKPEIFKEADLKPGMKGFAWTVFEGTQPEAVPIEILGVEKNLWGPPQDIILAKMSGKAERTNVAAGMTGTPVYI